MSKFHRSIIARLLDLQMFLAIGLPFLIIGLEYGSEISKMVGYIAIISYSLGTIISKFTKPESHAIKQEVVDNVIEIDNGVA